MADTEKKKEQTCPACKTKAINIGGDCYKCPNCGLKF